MEGNDFELVGGERPDDGGHKNTLLFDMLLVEADRVAALRVKELDLFFQDPMTGEFRKVGIEYNHQLASFKDRMFNKKKTRYFITFLETFEQEDKLKPVALKIIRHFARTMGYGNTIKGYGIRDIISHFGVHQRYVSSGLNQLFENDLIRYTKFKGRRTYMINPIYYFKGTPSGLFHAIRSYNQYPTFEFYLKEKLNKEKV